MNVIDFRLRPPTNEYKASFERLAARVGMKMPDSWNNSSLDACVAEPSIIQSLKDMPWILPAYEPDGQDYVKKMRIELGLDPPQSF